MGKFHHDPVYKDVEILNRTGFWPKIDGVSRVPAWALERAKAWRCSPVCGTVIEEAMKFEIRRLRRELKRGPQNVIAKIPHKELYHVLTRITHRGGNYYGNSPFWGLLTLEHAQDIIKEKQ